MIGEIWAYVCAVEFWTWYQLTIVVWAIGFIGISWAEGKATAKDIIVATAIGTIPIINMIAIVMIFAAAIIAIFESDQDLVVWERKKQRVPK